MIPSFITLFALLCAIAMQLFVCRGRNAQEYSIAVIKGIFSLFGGLLLFGAISKVAGTTFSPLITSLIVLVGTSGVSIALALQTKKREASTEN